jgi:lipopolysaccharide export system protein LptC
MTHLSTPQLTLYRKSPVPWYVTSKFAEATKGAEHVNFREDVMVQHAADQHNPATVIKTATLTVLPNAEVAETSDEITMEQPNIVIKGIGMRADMNTGDIQLLSQARGVYVPNS